MPGETISFDSGSYPEMRKAQVGDEVTIMGRIVSADGGMLELETTGAQISTNPAETAMKDQMKQPGMKRSNPMPERDDDEDY